MEKEKIAVSVARFVRSGQLAKAVPELERLVNLEPADARFRLELAVLYSKVGQTPKAVDQLAQLARRYEKDGFGLKALGCWLQVSRLAPDNKDASLALGAHYAAHGLFSDAAAAFGRAVAGVTDDVARLRTVEKILELDPENVADRIRLAEGLSARGLLPEAARELRKVADVVEQKIGDHDYPRVAERLLYHQPDDAVIAKRLAAVYVAQEEPQRALPKLKKAYDARPEDLEVLSLLADCFAQLGQVHKSVAVLKEMARLYDLGGLVHERDECWTKVLGLDPNDPQARQVLGNASQEAGQTFEVPYHAQPLPKTEAPPAPREPARVETKKATEFDDFDDFDGDEVGFGGTAENTIVDDAFLPDDLRESSGLGLALGAEPAPAADTGKAALQEDLKELDFYIGNGLTTEAEALLKDLLARHGADNPLLDRRAQQVAKLK